MSNTWLDSDDWRSLSDDELAARLRPQLRRNGLSFSDTELADVIKSRDTPNVADWITQVLARS
jgi:hypothetical protein